VFFNVAFELSTFNGFVEHLIQGFYYALFAFKVHKQGLITFCGFKVPCLHVTSYQLHLYHYFLENGTRTKIFDLIFVDNLLDSHLHVVDSPFKSPFIANDGLFYSLPFVSPSFDSLSTCYICD
jgi:hypothetical protein